MSLMIRRTLVLRRRLLGIRARVGFRGQCRGTSGGVRRRLCFREREISRDNRLRLERVAGGCCLRGCPRSIVVYRSCVGSDGR
jgi:hypothetical protein